MLLGLLDSSEDSVRKTVSLKIIVSHKASKIKSLLDDYLYKKRHRYYNVIFWLDFGVAMPKSIIRKAVNLIVNNSA